MHIQPISGLLLSNDRFETRVRLRLKMICFPAALSDQREPEGSGVER